MKHDWFQYSLRFESCKNCGIVRKRDGSNDENECKGVVYVTLREEKTDGKH